MAAASWLACSIQQESSTSASVVGRGMGVQRGECAGACQSGAIALSAGFYPAEIRSTGVGWAIAAGRLGATVGPLLGGVLLSRDWPVHWLFLVMLAMPALVGFLCTSLFQTRAAQSLRDI